MAERFHALIAHIKKHPTEWILIGIGALGLMVAYLTWRSRNAGGSSGAVVPSGGTDIPLYPSTGSTTGSGIAGSVVPPVTVGGSSTGGSSSSGSSPQQVLQTYLAALGPGQASSPSDTAAKAKAALVKGVSNAISAIKASWGHLPVKAPPPPSSPPPASGGGTGGGGGGIRAMVAAIYPNRSGGGGNPQPRPIGGGGGGIQPYNPSFDTFHFEHASAGAVRQMAGGGNDWFLTRAHVPSAIPSGHFTVPPPTYGHGHFTDPGLPPRGIRPL